MKYFPFYIDLKKKSVLLIGGGEVAERKLDLLIKAKANVTLISPETTPYILDIAEKNNIKIINEEYSSQHLDKKYSFVIAATNNEKLNKSIALDANKNNILVNVVDRPEICDFIFPSILERGDITVSVSTGGASPVLARMLRTKLETMIPGAYGKVAKIIAENRVMVREKLKQSQSNKIFGSRC